MIIHLNGESGRDNWGGKGRKPGEDVVVSIKDKKGASNGQRVFYVGFVSDLYKAKFTACEYISFAIDPDRGRLYFVPHKTKEHKGCYKAIDNGSVVYAKMTLCDPNYSILTNDYAGCYRLLYDRDEALFYIDKNKDLRKTSKLIQIGG